MRTSTPLLVSLLIGWPLATSAQPTPGLHYGEWHADNDRSAQPDPKELSLISYFFTRGTVTNQLADPAGLRGVSLGPIGIGDVGSATKVGPATEAYYIEQRWIPVISYSPDFADGLATLRAQLEIDFMWGQAANQLQHNQGGGLNADNVNIQTKNVNAAIYPTRNPKQLSIVLGTQSLYDSVYDPATTSLFDIVRTGYKLAFMGTDGTGLSIYGGLGGRWKASFVPFGVAQPNKATEDDARFSFVYLLSLDYSYDIMPGTVIGASFWHLQDDTKGKAFAYEGLVNSGPASGGLASYTGTAPFDIERATGNVEYVGLNFHHNINFETSRWAASGFAMLNFGGYKSHEPATQKLKEVDILGAAANVEVMWNWGRALGDQITAEVMFTTGDSDPNDGTFSSPFTMNNYGLPGAVWFNHKTLLLFPFTNTVSNYTGAITDISNQGFGLLSGIVTGAWDVIPDKLNLKVGAAYAQSTARPPATAEGIERGHTVGAEFNAELEYHIRYLMTVGLHFGYLAVGNFYDGNPNVLSDPWALFSTFTWYAF